MGATQNARFYRTCGHVHRMELERNDGNDNEQTDIPSFEKSAHAPQLALSARLRADTVRPLSLSFLVVVVALRVCAGNRRSLLKILYGV